MLYNLAYTTPHFSPMNDTPPPPQKTGSTIGKRILRVLIVILILGMLGASYGAWWLWGWKLGGIRVHESWSPQQRDELLMLAQDMRDFKKNLTSSGFAEKKHQMEAALEEALQKSLEDFKESLETREDGDEISVPKLEMSPRQYVRTVMDDITEHVMAKLLMARPYAKLRQLAATGEVDPTSDVSVAQVACRMGYIDIAAEIIRRGEDPNIGITLFDFTESAFQSALLCEHYFDYTKNTPAEGRIPLLNVMLEHGANINKRNTPPEYANDTNVHFVYASISAMRSPSDHGAILKWLLEHGLQIISDSDEVAAANILAYEGTLPTIKELFQKGLLPDTPRMKAILLQAALQRDANLDSVLWCLDELGADPNLEIIRKEYDEDEDGKVIVSERSDGTAADCFTRNGFSYYGKRPLSDEDKKELENNLRIMECLLAHGAQLKIKKHFFKIPEEGGMRERYMEVLNKYHVEIQE